MEQYRLKYNSPSTIPETLTSRGITLNSQPTLPQILSIISDYNFVKTLYEPVDYTWVEIEAREKTKTQRGENDTLYTHIKSYDDRIKAIEEEEKRIREAEAERLVIEEMKAKKIEELEKAEKEQEEKDRQELENLKQMEKNGELEIAKPKRRKIIE